MNRKSCEVYKFDGDYVVQCYIDSLKVHEWRTDNPLAVGYIINVWFAREHTSEELMTQLVSDIL